MLSPCRVCGQQAAIDAKVCPHCGTPHPSSSLAAAGEKMQSAGCAMTLLVTVPILLGLLLLGMCA